MLVTERSSLQLFGHSIYMSAKPTEDNLETFLDFMDKKGILTVVPLLPLDDIYRIYGFDLLDIYEDDDLNVIHFPIDDFETPSNIKIFDYFLDDVGNALKSSNILIHCSAGLGRTGLVTASLIIKYKKESYKDAIKLVRKSRWGTIETDRQEWFLSQYDYYINGDR